MNTKLDELTKELQKDPKNSKLLRKLGLHYLANGYYKQARDEYHLAQIFSPRIIAQIMLDYESVLNKNTNDTEARLSLASFCLASNDIDAAILELEELLDLVPLRLQVYNILGRIYIKQEKIDEALLLLEKAMKLGIRDLSISEMLASVYLEKGRLKEAIQFYSELPEDKKNTRTLAELYQRTNQFDKSAERYFKMYESDHDVASEVQMKLEELLARDIGSVEIREYLSQIYAKTLNPGLAVKKLSEITKIAPQKSEEAILKLKDLLKNYPDHPEIILALAENLAQKGRYSEAIEEYYKLIKNKPDMISDAVKGCKIIIEKYPDQFLARQFLIESYLAQEEFDSASSEIKKLLKQYPDSSEWVIGKIKDASKKQPEIKECLGYAYLAKGDFHEASACADGILSRDRQNIKAMILQGEILLKQKMARKASEVLNSALKLSPFDPVIHEKYREAKLKELDLEAAELKKRIAQDEWKISLHLDLAKNALLRGAREEALRELQLVSKDAQRAPQAFNLLGNFYRASGLYEQSLDAFRKSLKFSSEDKADDQRKTKLNMALAYEAQGHVRYAVKLLEEIEQEDVDFPGVKAKIRFLKNTSLASIQNKLLVLTVKDLSEKTILGMWGRESKKTQSRTSLSVSFGQNYNISGLEFFFKGMRQAAEEEFNLAYQLDPNFLPAVNNLAAAQLINNRISESLINFKKAYDLEPASALVQNNLGLALLLSQRFNEAEETLLKAKEFDPELTAAKINLADALYLSGKAKEAIEFYGQIQETDIMCNLAQQRLLYKTP